MTRIKKADLIKQLKLEPHPTEGGYFRRTYASGTTIQRDDQSHRRLLTCIYYLLTDDSPQGCLHRNKSDIIHFHHTGLSIKYTVISDQGNLQEHLLGPNFSQGEQPQLLVRGGDWKQSQLCFNQEDQHHSDPYWYGLISEAVAPGFEYEDNEIATTEQAQALLAEAKAHGNNQRQKLLKNFSDKP